MATVPANPANPANDQKNDAVDDKKKAEPFFLSFHEICTNATTSQATKIQHYFKVILANPTFKIASTQELVFTDLYNAGKRITGATIVDKDNKFYVSVHKRDPSNNLDETQIQQYQIIADDNLACKFNVKYLNTVCTIFKDAGVNSEGIGSIFGLKKEHLGFITVNDRFCTPKNAPNDGKDRNNSNIYFVDKTKNYKTRILYSLNDFGVAELNDICYYFSKEFKKDGYFLLPQSLCLATFDNPANNTDNKDNTTDNKDNNAVTKDTSTIYWEPFEKWMISNHGNAHLYFIHRRNVLEIIENTEDDAKIKNPNLSDLDFELIMHPVVVILTNPKHPDNIFRKYSRADGYVMEGFEAISIDDDNNVVLLLEATKDNIDTITFVLTAKIHQNQSYDYRLELHVECCEWKTIQNNKGGKNYAQEALIYVKGKL